MNLLTPPYRYEVRTISSQFKPATSGLCLKCAWRVVSEDSDQIDRPFLLIVRTAWIVTVQSN